VCGAVVDLSASPVTLRFWGPVGVVGFCFIVQCEGSLNVSKPIL
jgi:hypothetical protein